jgi:hypothetical protein
MEKKECTVSAHNQHIGLIRMSSFQTIWISLVMLIYASIHFSIKWSASMKFFLQNCISYTYYMYIQPVLNLFLQLADQF